VPAKQLVAYVTVAIRCLDMRDERCDEELSRKMNVNNGVAQSYLIGQLGKVDGYDNVREALPPILFL